MAKGENLMDYLEICKVYEELESTTKGLEKTKIISNFLNKIKDQLEIIYLLQGRVFPDYDPHELGMSSQLVIKAISKAGGFEENEIIQEFKEEGDLGKVAYNLLSKKKKQTALFSKKLTEKKVIENLTKITLLEGKGTVGTKIDYVVDLLNSSSEEELKYIVRTVLGDLRVGVGNGLLRDSIVDYCFKPETLEEKREYTQKVQDAYNKSTDFALVFKKAIENKLDEIELSVGKPVRVMLYPKVKDVEEAFSVVGKPAAFEYKYDGFRVVINKDEKGEIKIFTRRLEEVSNQFPEIKEYIKENVKGKSFIIDGEAIGYDPKTKRYTPFQAISQRIKRKYDIEKLIEKLPIELRLFDVLLYEEKSMIEENYEERRKLLEKIITEKPFKIGIAERIVTDNEEKAREFFDKAIKDNQEGLMVKGLDKPYKPGSRIGYGVKWKPIDKDFDLVITGAERGTGKRSKWFTSFDVSCQDEQGNLLEIGKVSGGLKEKDEEGLSYNELSKMVKELEVEEHGRKIKVKPKIIVTVQYQNIQKSPTYSSGYALRFPRIMRLRPDRDISDVSNISDIMKEASD